MAFRWIRSLAAIALLALPTGCVLESALDNRPPNARAGADRTVALGESVDLDGTASFDPDGDILEFDWRLVDRPDGSQATIDRPDTARAGFTPDRLGTYEVVLRVSDGQIADTDRLIVEAGEPEAEPVTLVVDTTLAPDRATLPPLEAGGQPRPIATTRVGDDNFQSDFVADEVILRAPAGALQPFLERWNGQVIRTIAPEPESDFDFPTRYVVRLDTSRANPTALPAHLARLAPQSGGTIRVSSDQGLALIAAAAAEAVDGVAIDLNWLAQSTQASTFDDRTTRERPVSGRVFENAFDLSYIRADGPQATGVGEAWIALERAGRLSNRVTIAVIDGGFATNPDFPAATQSFTNESGSALNTPNPSSCSGSPCPWHGTGAVGAAMGLPDNMYGGVGPAGPVARAVTIHTSLTHGSVIDALGKAASRAPIINMSFRGKTSAVWAWTLNGYAEFVTDVFRNGNLMIAAAGNDDENVDLGETAARDPKIYSPCEFAGVVCVGALASNADTRISYSNYGGASTTTLIQSSGSVDIFAPTNIRVGAYPNAPGSNNFNGTSAAAPFTAGIAALIKAADPSLSRAALVNLLIQNAHTGSSDPEVPRWVNARDAVLAALDADNPPRLIIDAPAPPGTRADEGVDIAFQATVDDLDTNPSDYQIQWRYDRDGTPFTFATTTSGERVFRNPFCDGTYEVVVEAIDPSTSATATARVSIEIDDLGATDPPDACAPTVAILEPVDNMTYPTSSPITLRAEIDDDHPETDRPLYPIIWRGDAFNGPEIGRGRTLTHTFAPSSNLQVVHVSYGSASDTVRFRVIETTNKPPVARIVSPGDGETITDFSNQPIVTFGVSGMGIDPEDGRLPDARVSWSYRQVGTTGWVSAGTGEGQLLKLRDRFCRQDTSYDIRLRVTDSKGLSGVETIRVQVRGLIC